MLSIIDDAKVNNVVIDLQHVTFMGSSGFLAFLAVRRRLEVGRIVICNIAKQVRELLELCRLISKDPSMTAAFEVEDSLATALERFSG